jgi:hypothetical protein
MSLPPELGSICAEAPPLELKAEAVEVAELVEEVEFPTGTTTGGCDDSSEMEPLDAESPRGETGGEGVEEEVELLSWEVPAERPRGALGREACGCCEVGGCCRVCVVSMAEMEITGFELAAVKAGVDLEITIEAELRWGEGEELFMREEAEEGAAAVAEEEVEEEVAEVDDGVTDEESVGAELEFANGEMWVGWGDLVAAY